MSSVTRAIAVLDLLAHKGPIGMRAVAQALDLPLGSVHRLLHDLQAEQAVERDGNGDWELSVRLFEITGTFLHRLEFPRLTRPHCERIAEATGETVNIHLLRDLSVVCIDKVRGSDGAQLDWPIGSRAPLHCGGGGKAILAHLGEAEREGIVAGPLTAYTEQTLIEPRDLRAELSAIRRRGYAIDDQEMVLGVYCVAVPIVDHAARPLAAISISGSQPKMPGDQVAPLVTMLDAAASRISRRLGYVGPWPPAAEPTDGAPARAMHAVG